MRRSRFPTDAASQAGWHAGRAREQVQPPQNQDVYLLKTDHEFIVNHHLSLRYNRQKFPGVNFENGGMTNACSTPATRSCTPTPSRCRTRPIINNSLFNEVRGQYVKDSEPGKANSAHPEAQIKQGTLRVLNIGRNTFSPRETTIKRNQIADTRRTSSEPHLQGRLRRQPGQDPQLLPGQLLRLYSFNSLADFPNGKRRQFTAGVRRPGNDRTDDPSRHDGVRGCSCRTNGRPTLTVNAGLRYDKQQIAQPSVLNPDAQLPAAGIDTSRDSGGSQQHRSASRLRLDAEHRQPHGRPRRLRNLLRPHAVDHDRHGTFEQRHQRADDHVHRRADSDLSRTIYTSMPTGVTLPKPTIFVFDRTSRTRRCSRRASASSAVGNDIPFGSPTST